MREPQWTLDELAERVDGALAVDYAGQPSGRVRAVPDRRAIRWYTTIGLIDRPVAHRGRTALYGPRHLLQLVAVKRLQARGLPLVAIQQELAGATDTQLARVARLPASPVPLDGGSLSGAEAWPAAAEPPEANVPRAVAGRARRAGFWREQAVSSTAALGGQAAAPEPGGPVATLRGVRLGDGATLLLEPGRELHAADTQAILDAARPLLAVLRDRGLGRPAGSLGPGPDPRPVGEHGPRPGPGAPLAGEPGPRREHP